MLVPPATCAGQCVPIWQWPFFSAEANGACSSAFPILIVILILIVISSPGMNYDYDRDYDYDYATNSIGYLTHIIIPDSGGASP